MVYKIDFICLIVTRSQNDAKKYPIFPCYAVTLKKHTSFHRVIANIYKHHFINFKYHSKIMFQYFRCFLSLAIRKENKRFTPNCINGMLSYRFYILSNSFYRIHSECTKITLNTA